MWNLVIEGWLTDPTPWLNSLWASSPKRALVLTEGDERFETGAVLAYLGSTTSDADVTADGPWMRDDHTLYFTSRYPIRTGSRVTEDELLVRIGELSISSLQPVTAETWEHDFIPWSERDWAVADIAMQRAGQVRPRGYVGMDWW